VIEATFTNGILSTQKLLQQLLNRGFLQTADKWQDRLFKERPSAVVDYFLSTGVSIGAQKKLEQLRL
jgi:hypothetical protein